MTTPPLDLTAHDLDIIRTVAGGGSPGDVMTIKNTTVLALLDRLEAAERDLAAVTVSRDGWQTRAEAAEAAVARVEAICQDTDGNWLDPEDECNNVGSILQAVRGAHTKQLGGTPAGEFADVCSCGKSYWPCDSLDGGA